MIRAIAAALAIWLLAPAPASAQDRGAGALENAIAMLRHDVPRVLMIGAHPDDEDTRIISWLARGGRAETAYLSLSRGDGGQNLIGNELGEALGVIRTQELLAARRIDGARQYFSRAYDFGFSKNAEESFQRWPRDSVLGDVVTTIRAFRPHVIIALFTGTPADGHGQHQVSGILAREGYDFASDTARFPIAKHGAPWTPLKFYRGPYRAGDAATLRFNVGEYSALLGRSYAEVAAESRSQHKSQGFGALQRKGVIWDVVQREHSRVNAETPATSERTMFDGLPAALVAPARRGVTSPDSALTILAAFRPLTAGDSSRYNRAAAIATGLALEAITDREAIAEEDSARVTYTLFNRGTRAARVMAGGTERSILPDSAVSWTGFIRAGSISQPWWLARPRNGDLFGVPISSLSEDEREQAGWQRVPVSVAGLPVPVEVGAPPVYRFADPVRGDVQQPLVTAPAITVTPQGTAVFARADVEFARRVNVTVQSNVAGDRTVIVRVLVPRGMTADSAARTIILPGRATRTVSFELSGRLPAGDHVIGFEAETDGRLYDRGFRAIAYDHIAPQRMYRDAFVYLFARAVRISANSSIGYIRGVSDDVADVLAQLDLAPTVIPPAQLSTVDLTRFSTIVVGPRAYEAEPELLANNQRLLDYVAHGGRLVVQYGQYEMTRPGVMPYPIAINRPHDRVADETAPVTIMDRRATELNSPNVIKPSDFEGWFQERALYMPRTIDPRYRTPLEMHDPGEMENRGALLVASVGRGTYVYTTIAFFRQLRVGVPGAIRLFVNLLTAPG